MFYILLFFVLRKWIVFAMLDVVGNNSHNISINSVEFDGAKVPIKTTDRKRRKREYRFDFGISTKIQIIYQCNYGIHK